MSTIAYLGPQQTNTHLAAQAKFGQRSKYLHAPTVEDVFRMVEREEVNFGVVPVENSLGGAVTHTLDRFIDFRHSPIKIYGEIEQPIRHALIFHKETPLNQIDTVFSHPQALAQCHRWLQQHLAHAERQETNSTAEAVSFLTGRRHESALRERAAIARKALAGSGLKAVPIPQERENKTRFLILSLKAPTRGRRNKTSVLFALKDKPGALQDALVPFKENKINLTKIESRPSRRKTWEYLFFIDIEGYESDPRIKQALGALKRHTTLLRVLGSYPATLKQT